MKIFRKHFCKVSRQYHGTCNRKTRTKLDWFYAVFSNMDATQRFQNLGRGYWIVRTVPLT